MNEPSLSEKAMIMVGVTLLAIVVGGFVWIWFGTPRPPIDQFSSTVSLDKIDVSALESKAKSSIEGLKNNSGIPIPEPTGKMGRTDPFAAL